MKEKSGIIFLGTPQIAAACLKRLIKDGRPVKAVLTQPDRPVGRHRIVTKSPVKQAAEEAGIAVYTPESLKTEEIHALFEELSPALKDTAQARMDHPESSLQDLADELGVTKSCLNHRLRKLVEIADELSDVE